MGFTTTDFYGMSWDEFFTFREGWEVNQWEDLFKYRLMYCLQFNQNVKKQDQIKLSEFLPQRLDGKYLRAEKSDRLTLKEAIKMAQEKDGQHVGRLGT